MQKINVELILATRGDEKSSNGIITFVIDVPYYVWVEILTHRRFARNASSARAQKTNRHIDMGYYIPDVFYKQGDGMRSSDDGIEQQEVAKNIYLDVWEYSIQAARKLSELGVAKEQSNRVISPIKMIRGIITGTEDGYKHFLKLRNNKNADKAMQIFARQISEKVDGITWKISKNHVPFNDGKSTYGEVAARIARISYGNPQFGKTDKELGEKLIKDGHWSPMESIAFWTLLPKSSALCCKPEDLHFGFGWQTYRAILEETNKSV